MFKKFITNRKGTALLVAMLVMGVLISVSLALSGLILRETRITKEFLDSGRAYYAAESGIEMGLYGVKKNLPGWMPSGVNDQGYKYAKIDNEFGSVSEYQVESRCQAYPCFDESFDVRGADPKAFYDVLDLNESITIPLFVVNDDGTKVPVEHFTVEFFAPFNPQSDLKIANTALLSGWDIMRWKIFGIKNQAPKVTESISDFTALSMVNQGGVDFAANSTKPSWFGTAGCGEFSQRYNETINCGSYVLGGRSLERINAEAQGQVADVFAGNCLNTEAREYYEYEYIGQNGEKKLNSENIKSCYLISEFLQKHELNYLTLTNLMNPAVFKDEVLATRDVNQLSRLYFRVELADANMNPAATSREVSKISANGYSGNSKQSIEVQIRKGSFMPVFNFSLYSTYKDSELEETEGAWYADEEIDDEAPPALQ